MTYVTPFCTACKMLAKNMLGKISCHQLEKDTCQAVSPRYDMLTRTEINACQSHPEWRLRPTEAFQNTHRNRRSRPEEHFESCSYPSRDPRSSQPRVKSLQRESGRRGGLLGKRGSDSGLRSVRMERAATGAARSGSGATQGCSGCEPLSNFLSPGFFIAKWEQCDTGLVD